MRYRSRSTGLTALLLGLPGCGGTDPVSPPVQQQPVTATPPRVLSASVAPNPNSVLSAVVTFSAEEAESARVVFVDAEGRADSTPPAPLRGVSDTIVALGLRPGASYRNVVEVIGKSGAAVSDTLPFSTPAVPELLGRARIATTGRSSG